MAKSKFFRVAVEGQTTDGRKIERKWLEDAAATYNRDTYAARVNMEHLRGFSPEPPFNAYGDVLALETREIELDVGGKKQKRLALYAQIDATDQLVAVNKKRQKLFTSCEFSPNFAETGKAYLVGLAVTDSPASLGTEMLAFAAGQGENNPLANRKQDKANLFTAADELELELAEAEAADDAGDEPVTIKGLVQLTSELLKRFTGKPEGAAAPPANEPPADPAPPANDNLESLATALSDVAKGLEASDKARGEELSALKTQVEQLTSKLETTEAPGTKRPIATGAKGFARTDC
jgi:hypothetical protein